MTHLLLTSNEIVYAYCADLLFISIGYDMPVLQIMKKLFGNYATSVKISWYEFIYRHRRPAKCRQINPL